MKGTSAPAGRRRFPGSARGRRPASSGRAPRPAEDSLIAPWKTPRARLSGPPGAAAFLLAALAFLATPDAAYHYYYANLHSHSALSDGIGTPAEAYAYARDVADIDVLALTDHTHYLFHHWWENRENCQPISESPPPAAAD